MDRHTTARRAIPPHLIMLVSFASTSVINYAFGLVTGWLLLPGDFGQLAFAQTLLLIGGLVLNSGFAGALAAAIAPLPARERPPLIRGALAANLAVALALAALVAALFALGPLAPGLETWPVAAAVVLAFPLLSVLAIGRATAQGSGRFGTLAAIVILEIAFKAITGLALVRGGYGVAGAVAGFPLGALVAAVPAVAVLRGALSGRARGPVTPPSLRTAGAMFGALLGMALLLNLDVLSLKLLSDADRALMGQYQAGIVLANTPYYLTTAMLTVLFTQFARLRRLDLTAPLVGEAMRLALLFLVPIELVLAVAPATVLGLLFPQAYAPGADALRILAVANSAVILVAILSSAFQATGNARIPARILLAVVLVEAAVQPLVVPVWHAQGAASVFLAAALAALTALGLAYARAVGGVSARRSLAWLARYGVALAAGAAVGIATLASTGSLVAAAALASAPYLGLAAVLKILPGRATAFLAFARRDAAHPAATAEPALAPGER